MGSMRDKPKTDNYEIDYTHIPRHVAIIMDGNGRWARAKGLPRIAGHKVGMTTVIDIAKTANELGIEIVTFFTFSTDNWKRPEDEVSFLMDLPTEFLIEHLEELISNNIQIRVMGNHHNLPKNTLIAVDKAKKMTKKNTGTILNFALNYGGRTEIVDAAKDIYQELLQEKIKIEDIDEEMFAKHLDTAGYPDPELLIRTSGELRLSNFLIWQLAYAELWFTDVYWPDFTADLFKEAIHDYQLRSRRFGGI